MRCTALRCPAQIRAAIVFVAALLWIAAAEASERPQYGGVLRVELRASSVATNPQKWKLGSPELANNERLAALLFDRFGTWTAVFYGSAILALIAAAGALVLRAAPLPKKAAAPARAVAGVGVR